MSENINYAKIPLSDYDNLKRNTGRLKFLENELIEVKEKNNFLTCENLRIKEMNQSLNNEIIELKEKLISKKRKSILDIFNINKE